MWGVSFCSGKPGGTRRLCEVLRTKLLREQDMNIVLPGHIKDICGFAEAKRDVWESLQVSMRNDMESSVRPGVENNHGSHSNTESKWHASPEIIEAKAQMMIDCQESDDAKFQVVCARMLKCKEQHAAMRSNWQKWDTMNSVQKRSMYECKLLFKSVMSAYGVDMSSNYHGHHNKHSNSDKTDEEKARYQKYREMREQFKNGCDENADDGDPGLTQLCKNKKMCTEFKADLVESGPEAIINMDEEDKAKLDICMNAYAQMKQMWKPEHKPRPEESSNKPRPSNTYVPTYQQAASNKPVFAGKNYQEAA